MTRITTETGSRLVGALIGLVRATDGMMHVTDDTNNIIIEGLHMSDMTDGSAALPSLLPSSCSVRSSLYTLSQS